MCVPCNHMQHTHTYTRTHPSNAVQHLYQRPASAFDCQLRQCIHYAIFIAVVVVAYVCTHLLLVRNTDLTNLNYVRRLQLIFVATTHTHIKKNIHTLAYIRMQVYINICIYDQQYNTCFPSLFVYLIIQPHAIVLIAALLLFQLLSLQLKKQFVCFSCLRFLLPLFYSFAIVIFIIVVVVIVIVAIVRDFIAFPIVFVVV